MPYVIAVKAPSQLDAQRYRQKHPEFGLERNWHHWVCADDADGIRYSEARDRAIVYATRAEAEAVFPRWETRYGNAARDLRVEPTA